MDDIIYYRQVIREIIHKYAQFKPSIGEVQVEVIIDETNDHYELTHAGWRGDYRSSSKKEKVAL